MYAMHQMRLNPQAAARKCAKVVGEVMGDLSGRRGKIGGMFERGAARVVAAHVPLGEMFEYATRLRSMTQGRGIYTMQFSRYDFMPDALAEEIVKREAARKAAK
jgi:elongation factor G